MPIQPPADIVRRSDGSIDIDFYARQGARLRDKARTEAFGRIAATAARALRFLARPMKAHRHGDAQAHLTTTEHRAPAAGKREQAP